MKNRIIAIIILGGLAGGALISCNKFLDAAPPKDQFNSAYVFDNDVNALAAITGLYIQMPNYIKTETSVSAALYADDIALTVTDDTWWRPYYESHLPYDGSQLNACWNGCYNFIYLANSCIEGIAASDRITDSLKKQLTGEALFFRALTYFVLVNTFETIPLVNKTNFQENASLPQASTDAVYKSIEDDLVQARSLLKEAYPTKEKLRVNKWAATALLARVYLYREKWEDARKMADSVIASNRYGPLPACETVFLKSSTEAILHIASSSNAFIWDANYFIPSSTEIVPKFIITPQLLVAMDEQDQRKKKWLGFITVAGEKYYYPAKYKDVNGNVNPEYYVLLRLAEQYLIRAESHARLNKFDEAIADLNVVRQRAGIDLIKAADVTSLQQLLDLILHERRLELFTEQGHRWFDLKRSGTVLSVMKAQKPATWQDKAVTWPVPMKQLETNPFLSPNAGN